jgi:aspartate/methionine/tyrosine aminotransferase
MAEIETFHVVDLVTRAKALEAEGRTIVNLVVGEPDAPAAAPIAEAGIQAIRSGHVHYTPGLGTTALRREIARWYDTRYGVVVSPDRVGVMPGSSGALIAIMGALLSPGDEVLMADPSYPCNRHFVRTMEGRAVGIPVGPDTQYQLTAALVAKHWGPRTRAVMLASPSNPTGTLIPFDELRAIHEATRARGGTLIVDEIYHGLTYGAPDRTVLEFADDAFVINSFSKYFGMTGWRLGWLVGPRDAMADIEKLAQNLFISASDVAQQAAMAAFTPEACERALKGIGPRTVEVVCHPGNRVEGDPALPASFGRMRVHELWAPEFRSLRDGSWRETAARNRWKLVNFETVSSVAP